MGQPDPGIKINPAYVHSVGAQVKTDAQQLLGGESDGIQDFQNKLTTINDKNFPVQLYSTLYQFINIHTKSFTGIFQDRQKIGDGLQDTATAAEQTEIKAIASFRPTPLGSYGEPSEQPLY